MISDANSIYIYCIFIALMLPLISSVISAIVSESYSWISSVLCPFTMLLTVVIQIIGVIQLWEFSEINVAIPWFQTASSTFTANVLINHTSLLMMSVVSIISFLVHLYSTGYMAGDAGLRKYFVMLGIFTFAMNGIVLADNLLFLFLFWELVGFSSYMLIGHWNERVSAGRAALKAFVMNRIGDVGFIIGLLIIYSNTSTLDLGVLLSYEHTSWMTAASLCLFCGVIAKSAQLPLFTWLPDAMEGPTPVSALIHAATMVAAGVYLLVRTYPLFTPDALDVVLYVGMFTGLIGALCAAFQFDIKRILAYSTMSQLGLMIMAVGARAPEAAFLHLLTHAFFKAGLFLCAGSVIHAVDHITHRSKETLNAQDIRNLGGLRKKMPVTFIAFTMSAASLAGIPLFSGFISKEMILNAVLNQNSLLVTFAFLAVSLVTVIYSFRLIWFTFFGTMRPLFESIVDAPPVMRSTTVLLAIASLWPLAAISPLGTGMWWMNDTHGSFPALVLSTVTGFTGILLAILRYRKMIFKPYPLLENGLYVDHAYRYTVLPATLKMASFTNVMDRRVIDKALHGTAYIHVTTAHLIAWFDKVIVDGVVHLMAGVAKMIGAFFRSFQGGKIQLYLFWAILGMIIFLIWALKK